jgi:hypothetical protein
MTDFPDVTFCGPNKRFCRPQWSGGKAELSDKRQINLKVQTMKRYAKYSVILASLGAFQAVAVPVLNPVNGHYYEAISWQLTWDNAAQAAEQYTHEGVAGHLATVTSAAEQQFIADTFGGSFGFLWLGGFQAPNVATPSLGW